MEGISRMERILEFISNFIVNESSTNLTLDLYSSEIKRIQKRISDGYWNISLEEISKNPTTHKRTVKFSKR